MVITESLARGLKTRFFNEATDQIERDITGLCRAMSGKGSRASWDRDMVKMAPYIKGLCLSHYEGGGKRSPYLILCGLHVEEGRQVNHWQENCLRGMQAFINLYNERGQCFANFSIGEHAISRLIERGKIELQDDLGNFHMSRIQPALSAIPLWTAFWTRVSIANDQDLPMRPVVPTDCGLFLCELSYQELPDGLSMPMLEVRTFVENDSLTAKQRLTRDAMQRIGRGFERSPMALYPLISVYKLEDVEYIDHMMHARMKVDVDIISSVIFHHLDDSVLRDAYKKKFVDHVTDMSPPSAFAADEMLSEIGVREFHRRIKQSLCGVVRTQENIGQKLSVIREPYAVESSRSHVPRTRPRC